MTASFQQRRGRIGILTLAIGLLFLVVAARLVIVVFVDGPRLASMARGEHIGAIRLAAVRGPIVDRDGKPLALSVETSSVYARPRRLLESSTSVERGRLAAALGIATRELEHRLARNNSFVWLARHLGADRAQAVSDLGLDGVGAVVEYQRFYPESGLAAAVVGKAGVDGQGLSGVELQYDRITRGEPVELNFYHDALGHPISDSAVEPHGPRMGARLELTIDSTIQTQAENYLAAQVRSSGAHRGTAVVLDPFTGEILALADAALTRTSDADRLHDSAIQDAFEPGSTMKGILGAIALDDGVMDTHRQIFCEDGVWRVGGRMIHDDSPRGWLDLSGIVEVSSNIGAAKIALALGAQRFHAGLEAFGLGRKTGIDLPGEAVGMMRSAASWKPIELADHGFGQGVAVTPIQLAVAYAAIANGGMVLRPFVVKAAYDSEGNEIFVHTVQMLRRAVSPKAAHQMNQLLRGVVNAPDGTGHLAKVVDFTVAGKTGTAQMVNPATGAYYPNRLVASFVGFVPAQDPRLVILVVLYDVPHAHFGGLFAAPVFSSIASGALQHLEVAPERSTDRTPELETAGLLPLPEFSRSIAGGAVRPVDLVDRPTLRETSEEIVETTVDADETPDFHGLSLRAALELAHRRGLIPEIDGDGYVARQSPAAATPNHGAVKLELTEDLATRDRARVRSLQ